MPPAQQSPSKRQNLEISGDETADIDTTPQPKRSRPLRSESEHSLSSHLSYHSSQVSRQSSPRKQLQSLKLDARGIEFRDLVLFDDKPAELEDLLDAIDLVMEGKGIVSTLQQDPLVSASKSSKAFKILAAAAECSSNSHHEVNWNMEVHQPLLSLAFRPPDQLPYSHLVNFMGTIYIEPGNDSSRSAKDAISRCQRDLPESVFNFTDAAPLAHRPIAFSIETKKPSAGFDGAKLQIGIWQNAHWTFLRHLAQIVGEKCTAARPETITNTGDKVIMKKASDLPTFTPGIIIQGHF
ncbi:hypothetical protein FMUND_15215 [Fusarium mundagurra]|uniref:PD-(D/E)XK nuclease-like domain-containing protein n=1 Tax=Fusarium mundagurra TaxID=1567541 RepID=A0A8H6CZI3_9HYPO|nr:hypothetical protein FMUND_15215 [Fusarium mundagurra]